MHSSAYPTFWLEFKLLNDGLETSDVASLPLTQWHQKNTPVFRLFPSLPTELRLKIWEYLIVPRIVGIACLSIEDGGTPVEIQRSEIWNSQQEIRPSIPVLLHVNREARELALKHYELSFEWRVPLVLSGADLPPPAPPAPVPAPVPVIASPAPPPPSTTDTSNPAGQLYDLTGTLLPHISSYHDLLAPSPHTTASFPASTVVQSGTGSSGDPGPEGSDHATTTTHITTHPTPRSTYVPERRESAPPRTWFNFDLDAVYLLGELEPCDPFGFNGPMAYFIPSQTARRVRKIAVSFRALQYGETGGQQIFGALFHIVDRFLPEDGEVLVCVTEFDEWTHAMIGSDTKLLDQEYWSEMWLRSRVPNIPGPIPRNEDNVLQTLWRDSHRGSIAYSPLATVQFSLIAQEHLKHHVDDFILANPAKRKKGGAGTVMLEY